MNFFVDVDYTLLAADGSLRPHADTLLSRVTGEGHSVYIWSGVGIRLYEMTRLGLAPMVSDYFVKPTTDYRAALRRARLPVEPDLVVDDHSEIVEALGGVVVRPYFFADDRDKELMRVADVLLEYAGTGASMDSRFHAPPSGADGRDGR